ncbi:MAG: thiopurine S-methyltransferase [gamma proteobacterium symbiont of Bathyaustriella thionipta]|nr:thiopurine S-methyltransferase [gamma proteobacterium symbiont of Bathyaustriella thionipta]
MKAEFWIERWQNGQIGFHQEAFNAHLQNYWPALGLPAEACVFVPLCGKTLDLLWLRSQGHSVLAVEISELAVAAFFRENDLQAQITQEEHFSRWQCAGIDILCGDFFDLQAADVGICDALYDRASLVALPAAMRRQYVRHLQKTMPQQKPHLLVALSYDQNVIDGPPFSVEEAEVRELYAAFKGIKKVFSEDVISGSPHLQKKGLQHLQETVYCLQG